MIEYIIKLMSNESKRQPTEKVPQGHYRKIRVDESVFFCINCDYLWAGVAAHVDSSGWGKYPKGNMPTIGKERKTCPDCKEKNGTRNII